MIGLLYRSALKPILFQFDPERVHDFFLVVGSILGRFKLTKDITCQILNYTDSRLSQEIAGVEFSQPVGLSAGFDKDANLQQILGDVGFGFMQIGSVTYNAYEGNPKPRLHRLKKSKGLLVYYGLKNDGAATIIKRLQKRPAHLPISISIAKTNAEYTSNQEAGIKDYVDCLQEFVDASLGDFYTINISCPNTFGGEPFTDPASLEKLLVQLDKVQTEKAIFIKMPINLAWEDFNLLLQVIVKHRVVGVIIGNLNKDHQSDLIKDEIPEGMKGGISGKPTEELCNRLIAKTYQNYGHKLKIIGVGGIFSAQDAYEKIKLGASLVQLITGMIFQGPQLIGEINKGLVQLLEADGYSNISEAIGTKSL